MAKDLIWMRFFWDFSLVLEHRFTLLPPKLCSQLEFSFTIVSVVLLVDMLPQCSLSLKIEDSFLKLYLVTVLVCCGEACYGLHVCGGVSWLVG